MSMSFETVAPSVIQFGFAGFALYLMMRKIDDLKMAVDRMNETLFVLAQDIVKDRAYERRATT